MYELLTEISKTIVKLSGTYTPYIIFTDWVKMFALAISNSCELFHNDIWRKREDEYMDIAKKYNQTQLDEIVNMGKMLIDFYEQEGPYDALGEIYMASDCGNKATGQFFTPFHIAMLTAAVGKYPDNNETFYINEPSCGGGGMILATAKVYAQRGGNYQKNMKVVAQDIDWNSIYMTYVQLSLNGIDAICVQGNTLMDERPRAEHIFMTPKNKGALI